MTNAEARFNKSLRPRKPEGTLGRTAQDVVTLTQLLNYVIVCVPGHDPSTFSFLSFLFFDWVGVFWPQLSKVLKLVRWARRVLFPPVSLQ